jgi:hypothetical protein
MSPDWDTLRRHLARAADLNLKVVGLVVGDEAGREILGQADAYLHSEDPASADAVLLLEELRINQLHGLPVVRSRKKDAFHLIVEFPETT